MFPNRMSKPAVALPSPFCRSAFGTPSVDCCLRARSYNDRKEGANIDKLQPLGASGQLLLFEGRNVSGSAPCAKRTSCTGLNVERPVANAAVAPREFAHGTQIKMKATYFQMGL